MHHFKVSTAHDARAPLAGRVNTRIDSRDNEDDTSVSTDSRSDTDDLESRQRQRQTRNAHAQGSVVLANSGNDERNLTELAAPRVIRPRNEDTQQSYEDKNRYAEWKRDHPNEGESPERDRNVFLSELTAPRPVHSGHVHDRTKHHNNESDSENEESAESGDSSQQATIVDEERRPNGSRSNHDQQEQPQQRSRPPSSSSQTKQSRRQAIWLETASISWIIFFSILGTLARLGIEAITTYPYAPVTSPVIWANLGGSLFMGFLLEDRRLFRFVAKSSPSDPTGSDHPSNFKKYDDDDHDQSHEKDNDDNRKQRRIQLNKQIDKKKKILPLYIGLATGFCGSFTSFSTFITDAFLELTNTLPGASSTRPYQSASGPLTPRNGGYSFMGTLAILILQTSVSVSALKTGAHLAVGLQPYIPSIPGRLIHKVLDPLGVFLGIGSWIGALFLTIFPPDLGWRRTVLFSILFAPPGALFRYYISKWFNSRIPSFPLGTFIVNIVGTCVEGMAYDLQHARSVVGSNPTAMTSLSLLNTCGVLEGVMQGFCGCTTTVSTWVGELNSLRRRHAWIYGLASVGIALALQVVIMGSVAWTVGFNSSCSAV